ncbi:hypothetical protein KUTeg_021245 [Tegillarca granosa]|uniref:GST N-terminal domain-containing protein n=1 Tax=Tegillarca granosa TaxID=220873 RepID=A0ABQ9EA97_TEGGR|nr:hypothetical protein KUTeg_021245 [Tegillarca granosa]
MPSYKLTYFAGRGRGELSRLLFAVSGTKFEDVRVEFPDWPALKPKTPLGSLPLLETEGKTLVQSLSIARFLANKFGLLGKTVEDQAIADMIVATCEDVRVNLAPALFEQDPAAREYEDLFYKGK